MNKNVKKVVLRMRGNPSVVPDGRNHYSAEITYAGRHKGATEYMCEMKFTTDARDGRISSAMYEIGLILDIEGKKTAEFIPNSEHTAWIYTGNHY
jgi:hypothetical protein